MGKAEKETDSPTQTTDSTRQDDINLADSIKERLSPAVEMWVNLIADVIADEVLRERRGKAEYRPEDVGAPAGEPRRRAPAGIPRDDRGQKVMGPRGQLLTTQEAAEYLGPSPKSLSGRGWRMTNRLQAVNVGRSVRFDIEALDRWIDGHREHLPRLFAEGDE